MLKKYFKLTNGIETNATIISNDSGIITNCLLNNDSDKETRISLYISGSMKIFSIDLQPHQFKKIDLDMYISKSDILKISSTDSNINIIINFIGED